MKINFLKSLLIILAFAMSSVAHSQRGGGECMELYDGYYNCVANGFNNSFCNQAVSRWRSSNCAANICNLWAATSISGGSPPYVNCGVNQSRYEYCMNGGLGKGRPYASPEQYCKGWAGPAE